MIKKLLLFMMALAFALPSWASEYTVTIHRGEGLYQDGTGVYYCVKDGIMMTFTDGLDNENYLVERRAKTFEVRSANYIIKKVVFHCVDNTTEDNLDCFYWGPTTISLVSNFTYPGQLGNYYVTNNGYDGVWEGSTMAFMFTTADGKPVRFGSVDITYDKLDGDIFELVTQRSQIVDREIYIIVSQYHDKVMSFKKTDDATFPSANIVEWMNTGKTKVKVDGNACMVRMIGAKDSTYSGNTRRVARLSTLNNGYIRVGTGNDQGNLLITTSVNDYSRGIMYFGTNYNYLCWFKGDTYSNSSHTIRYDDSDHSFKVMSTENSDTRVWLYKLAQSYNVTAECQPTAGGRVTFTNGVVEGTSQENETVKFTVNTNWGWRINEVTAVNTTTGEAVPLTMLSTADDSNSYSFVMPAGNVHIVAKFYESEPDLFLLGTAMGRTNWVPAGPRFKFNPTSQEYYLDVYFKGIRDVNGMSDDEYGYFSLAQHIDAGTTWQTGEGSSDWGQVWGRLAAEYNQYSVADGSSNVVLYGDRPDNAFKIPAGVYRITVTRDMSRMSIAKIPVDLTLTPDFEGGSTLNNPVYVTYNQLVEASSNLQYEVHRIATPYGINEVNQQFLIKQDDAAQWSAGNTTNITKEGTTKVTSEAYIGYIIAKDSAYYAYTPLSYIERDEENKTDVVVCDDLVGTWAVVKDNVKYLWAKDDNRSNFRKEDVPAGQIDYLTDIGLQTRPWDQSNWVILDFSAVSDNPEEYVNKTINALTVKGTYEDKVNHRILLNNNPVATTNVVGYPGYNGDYNEENTYIDYYYNQYMSFNFLEKNLVADGVGPGTNIVPGVDTSKRFYFMNPKTQEVAHIMGVWIDGNYFSSFVPEGSRVNGYDLDGIFKVNWLYNRTQPDIFATPQGLESGTLYSFHGAVNVDVNSNGLSFNSGKPNSGENTPDAYTVYPFDLPSSPSPITAIVEVPADKTIESIRYYNIMGAQSDKPFQSVNIVVISFDDGSSSSIKVVK